MRVIISSLIVCFIFCGSLRGQADVGFDIDRDVTAITNYYPLATFDNRETTYRGSPLLWEDFTYATILLKGNKKYSPREYHINYDILSKQFYLRLGKDLNNLLLNKVKSLRVAIDANDYDEYKVLGNNKADLGLYEILYSSANLDLVKGTAIELKEAHYNSALDAGDVRPSLKRSEALFIYKSDQLFEIPKKSKRLKKFRGAKEIKEIFAYLNKSQVDLKDYDAVQAALIEFNKK